MRLPIFLLFLLFFSKNFLAQTSPDSISISGKIKMHPGWRPTMYLVQPENYRQILSSFEGKIIDSATVAADGSFYFLKKNLGEKSGLFRLCIQQNATHFPNKIEPFWMENFVLVHLPATGVLEISGEAKRLANSYKLEKSDAENRLFLELRNIRRLIFQSLELDENGQPKINPEGDSARVILHSTEKKVNRSLHFFLDSTRAFLPGFAALQYLNPTGNYASEPDFYLKINYLWTSLAPLNLSDWVADFSKRVINNRWVLAVGSPFPDKILENWKPKIVSKKSPKMPDSLAILSVPGRLRLVWFWASWHRDARKTQQEFLKNIYQKYQSAGLEIIGVSTDDKPELWQKALAEDAPPWPNGRLPGGRDDDFTFEIGLQDLPLIFLLDADGKVVARNLTNADLEVFLKRFFKKN